MADLRLTGPNAFSGFDCAVGARISPTTAPKTFALLETVARQAEGVYEPAKLRYPRPRPFLGNTLPICTERGERLSKSNSYPSGHAMVGLERSPGAVRTGSRAAAGDPGPGL